IGSALTHAVLVTPMFGARWRWNLNRSLVVLRYRGGRRNPPPIQRMETDDITAAVFPALAACQDNATGPREIPDHPLVRQELHDLLLSLVAMRPDPSLASYFEALITAGRAVSVHTSSGELWCALELRGAAEQLFGGARFFPDIQAPSQITSKALPSREELAA